MSATSPNLRHPAGRAVSTDTDDVIGRARTHAVDGGDSFFHRLVRTDGSFEGAAARLTLGLVMLPHALQKAVGAFGGYGLEGTFQGMVSKMGVPGPLAILAIAAELFGTVALIFGVLTRVGAAAIIAVMLGAIALVHAPHGFFMNWLGQQQGEGFEYHLLAIGLGIVTLVIGGGAISIDRILMKRRPAEGGSIGEDVTAA